MILNRTTIPLLIIGVMICICCRKPGADFGGTTGVGQPPAPDSNDTVPDLAVIRSWLTDKNATDETAALFYQLQKSSEKKILFGHQDATKRGYGWANEQHLPAVSTTRSDVHEVTGAYPVVYGHDFLHIAGFSSGNWFDYEQQIARQLTIEAYDRGGVNTYAWHYFNPVSKMSFYWNESPVDAVEAILPGGSHHEVFRNSLAEIAAFLKSLTGKDGSLVPVIFRPFHEFDSDWFWWGKAHCSPQQYQSLYRFTVQYLRDSLQVRNLLYAWSPDRNFTNEAQYLERYPGDEYVDVVGMDNYHDLRQGADPSTAAAKLKIISDYAIRKNKLAALTETGQQNLTQHNWYTASLLKALTLHKPRLAYTMVWSNTREAFWTPYNGHPATADFKDFKKDSRIIFSDKQPGLYKLK